jgi:hypothetical protein
MLAEFTTIGTLFGVYLGSKSYAITITVGVLTLLYTYYGGLFISIVTDTVQGARGGGSAGARLGACSPGMRGCRLGPQRALHPPSTVQPSSLPAPLLPRQTANAGCRTR